MIFHVPQEEINQQPNTNTNKVYLQIELAQVMGEQGQDQLQWLNAK